MLTFIHVLALGLWGGCVATEMVLEVSARLHKEMQESVARMHFAIDMFVELPIVLMVLMSGLVLFPWNNLPSVSLLLWIKALCGLTAVIANLWCFVPVKRRFQLVVSGKLSEIENESKRVFKAFYVGFSAGALALILGLLL